MSLLAEDATMYGDGGGKGAAAPRPTVRAAKVARFLSAIFERGRRLGGQLERVEVNGQPGAKLLDSEGALVAVMTLDVAGEEISAIRSIVNPDKLAHLGRLSPIGRVRSGDESATAPDD